MKKREAKFKPLLLKLALRASKLTQSRISML